MKKVLFALEGANCNGGAHIATRNLIARMLRDGYEVGVISDVAPNEVVAKKLAGARFHQGCEIKYHSFKWLLTGIMRTKLNSHIFPDWMIDPFGRARRAMLNYDVIVVCGETSVYRNLVSRLPRRIRKVIHVHTDYVGWIECDSVAMSFARNDRDIYRRYDIVAVVGLTNAAKMKERFFNIVGDVVGFRNLLELPCVSGASNNDASFAGLITLARIDDMMSKDGPRMVRVAKALKDAGCNFVWDVYGGGSGKVYDEIVESVHAAGLDCYLRLHGFDAEAAKKIATADVFVLLSHFEGLPNVIYESFAAGVPVFSTDVGAIRDQVDDGVNGWLVEDEERLIVERLKSVIENRAAIAAARKALANWHYDNDAIYREHLKVIFGGRGEV